MPNMPLTQEEIIALYERVLANDETLTELDLDESQLGDENIQALAKALENNTAITSLDLSSTWISDAGAQALAAALEKNTTITSLNLANNQITDAGAQALAKALEKNTTLTSLGLAGNQIGDAGALALAEALKKNTTLTRLNLFGNQQISDVGRTAISRASVFHNSTVTYTNINIVPINNKPGIYSPLLTEALDINKSGDLHDKELFMKRELDKLSLEERKQQGRQIMPLRTLAALTVAKHPNPSFVEQEMAKKPDTDVTEKINSAKTAVDKYTQPQPNPSQGQGR